MKNYKRIVIKIGTTSLVYENGKLNLRKFEKLAWVLSDLRNRGKEIILVSSGAIAAGAERLGLNERPRDVVGKQAASAVGQPALIQIYENFFSNYNQTIAQILLTRSVLDNETTRENAVNTFNALLKRGVIPIVNENDSVSTDELGFSENDTLSAYVATLAGADLLILLSDREGLLESDPRINPDAKIIKYVSEITPELLAVAGASGSKYGTGGMKTKLDAAKIAVDTGADAVIASGEDASILFDILDGNIKGTLFAGSK